MKDERPIYLLTLQPLAGVEPLRALRIILKRLLRAHGMKCLSVEQSPRPERADLGRAT
jgi:hypothetical protein